MAATGPSVSAHILPRSTWGGCPALSPDSTCLSVHTLGDVSDGSSNLVPAIHMEELHSVLSPAPALVQPQLLYLGSEPAMEELSLCLSNSASQKNLKK